MSMSGHQSPAMKSDTWLTPPEWIRALGPFDTDPCCPPVMPWPTATTMYSEAQNGLAQPWVGRVWLNPPFGQEWPAWVEKLANHGNGIALLPARTETEAFHRLVWARGAGILFVKGRPHFHYADGARAAFNSGAPIVLIAYGNRNCPKLIQCGIPGVFVDLDRGWNKGLETELNAEDSSQ
jgi:hypothetical protein